MNRAFVEMSTDNSATVARGWHAGDRKSGTPKKFGYQRENINMYNILKPISITVKPKVRTLLALQYCDLTTNSDNNLVRISLKILIQYCGNDKIDIIFLLNINDGLRLL